MKQDIDKLASDLLSGNRRALAKAISIVENDTQKAEQLIKKILPKTGSAHLIGITGSPGVGKSTLVDALVSQIRSEKKTVAVLAIDPSSPFTGGAILGDRVRMQEHTLDPGVFIRSMANRGHSGGTAMATYDTIRLLEAFGFEYIIVETVGVGQSELAIAQTADTTVLVLMPGSGDDIQAIKSGIMEIGEIFVVNKGDLPGANKTAAEVTASLELKALDGQSWHPPVLLCVAENNSGVDQLWNSIQKHQEYLSKSGKLKQIRTDKIKSELIELVADLARHNMTFSLAHSKDVQHLLDEVVAKKIDPHEASRKIMQNLIQEFSPMLSL